MSYIFSQPVLRGHVHLWDKEKWAYTTGVVISVTDFCIKTMFGSSLPPVVCRRDHVLFTLFVFVCIFCFVFLNPVNHMLPVSLDCPFLNGPSLFSKVYLLKRFNSYEIFMKGQEKR
jgi:hypothetical protein